MPRGTIKWFDPARGYGFILQLDGGPDLFVHNSEVDAAHVETLGVGRTVEFDVDDGDRGPHAVRVRSL